MATQCLFAPGGAPFEPLTHCPLRDAQGTSDLALLPTRLGQSPGAQASVVFPVVKVGGVFHGEQHSTFWANFTDPCSDQ
jgi:hypothetical protein